MKKLILFIFLFLSMGLFAQKPFADRALIEGTYDIRMISSPILVPANGNVISGSGTSASPYAIGIDSLYSDYAIITRGSKLIDNNVYKKFPAVRGTKFQTGVKANGDPLYTTIPLVPLLSYCDFDSNQETFSSSMAKLDLDFPACSEIKLAYLYWSGQKGSTVAADMTYISSIQKNPAIHSYNQPTIPGTLNESTYTTVKFKSPSMTNYVDVTALPTNVFNNLLGDRQYVCVADVTSHIKNGQMSGEYWVANMQSVQCSGDGGPQAGWTLLVVYKSPNCPPRSIKIWDGLEPIPSSTKSFTLSFNAPKDNNFKSYIGLTALDAERKVDGETGISAKFNAGLGDVNLNPHPLRVAYNDDGTIKTANPPGVQDPIFNSSITTYIEGVGNGQDITRLPTCNNTICWDAHHMLLPAGSIQAGATSASLSLTSNSGMSSYLVYMAIEVMQPNLQLVKLADKSTVDFASSRIGYTLKLYNKGGKKTNVNEPYIIDTLDIPISNIENFTCTSSLTGSLDGGTFKVNPLTGRKYLKININNEIPAVNPLTQSVASTDTLVFTFNAVIENSNYPEWKIKCRRNIKNVAYIHYPVVGAGEFVNQSNGDACGNVAALTPVQVQDPIFTIIDQRYNITKNITAEVQANPSLNVLNKLKQILSDEISPLNLPNTAIADFVFYNSLGVQLSGSEVFDINSPFQTYTAEIDMGGVSCIEVYTLNIILGKVPDLTLTATDVSCNGLTDGAVNLKANDGNTTETYSISLYAGSYSSLNPVLSTTTPLIGPFSYVGGTTLLDLGTASSLPAGMYTAVATATINTAIPAYYKSVEVKEPSPVTVNLSAPTASCLGDNISASASISGGPVGGVKSYSWFTAPLTNPTNFSQINGEITANILFSLNEDAYFYVDGGVNSCHSFSDTLLVDGLITPKVSVVSSDSGCYQYDLASLPVRELSGLTPSDYVLTLHTAQPSSATDNRFLIAPSKYNVKKTQIVWARMSKNDLCYSNDKGLVYVKSMEQCHPIVVVDFFSPDGDGINDKWIVGGLQDYTNPEIIVYDRFGKVVFKGGKEDLLDPNGWDGTYLGNPLPSADYWYQMNFLEIEPKVGHFTLKRKKE